MTTFISIQYTGQNPPTYKSVTVNVTDRDYVFDSGDPTRDYGAASIFAARRGGECFESSSVNHFTFDGGVLDDSDEKLIELHNDESIRDMVRAKEKEL